MLYITERPVVGIDLKKLYLVDLMTENHAEQRMSTFMHGRADSARYITNELAEHPKIRIKTSITKRNQKSEQKNYPYGKYDLQYKTR